MGKTYKTYLYKCQNCGDSWLSSVSPNSKLGKQGTSKNGLRCFICEKTNIWNVSIYKENEKEK